MVLQPQAPSGDQGKTAKALYDYQAGTHMLIIINHHHPWHRSRHFTLTVTLSTQVYKWVPANVHVMLG